jgi:hypothetical protein
MWCLPPFSSSQGVLLRPNVLLTGPWKKGLEKLYNSRIPVGMHLSIMLFTPFALKKAPQKGLA